MERIRPRPLIPEEPCGFAWRLEGHGDSCGSAIGTSAAGLVGFETQTRSGPAPMREDARAAAGEIFPRVPAVDAIFPALPIFPSYVRNAAGAPGPDLGPKNYYVYRIEGDPGTPLRSGAGMTSVGGEMHRRAALPPSAAPPDAPGKVERSGTLPGSSKRCAAAAARDCLKTRRQRASRGDCAWTAGHPSAIAPGFRGHACGAALWVLRGRAAELHFGVPGTCGGAALWAPVTCRSAALCLGVATPRTRAQQAEPSRPAPPSSFETKPAGRSSRG